MKQTDNFCAFDTKKEIEALVIQPPGAFLLQQVSKKDFILSVCAIDVNDSKTHEILHFLVVKTSNGYKFKESRKEFPTLRALITHHSVMPELLPHPLFLVRNKASKKKKQGRKNLEEYNSYEDLKKIILELNIGDDFVGNE